MAPRPLKRPAHIPPLSTLLSTGQPLSTGGSPVPLSANPVLVRPANVTLLIDDAHALNDGSGQGGWGRTAVPPSGDHSDNDGSGQGGWGRIAVPPPANAQPLNDGSGQGGWGPGSGWVRSIAIGNQPEGKVTKVSGLVAKSSKDLTRALSGSGLSTATVKLLDKNPPTITEDSQQKHFALPTISTNEPIRDNLSTWLDALAVASKNEYTVELTLEAYGDHVPPPSGQDQLVAAQYEQIEELLSKAYTRDFEIFNLSKGEVRSDEEARADEIKGARFILDAFGGPPTHLTSSQLLRSTQLQDWSGFCSRLALHPRVYVKLSPPVASLKKSGGLKALDKEARAEFRRTVRIWIDAVLDALGDERLIFAATGLEPGIMRSTDAAPSNGDEDDSLTEMDLWFEIVREVLADIGLDALAMGKIFEGNAQKLYDL